MSLTRLLWVVRIMRRHSSAMTAIGLSHSTWTPARAASTANSQCIELGSARKTAFTSSRCRHCRNSS